MNCSICGKEIEKSEFVDSIPPLCGFECYSEFFWNEKAKEYGDGSSDYAKQVAIIDHTHWYIEPDAPLAYFKGCGGAEYVIKFNDGREVITHNLWLQGDIPESHWDKLPDNAKFVQTV